MHSPAVLRRITPCLFSLCLLVTACLAVAAPIRAAEITAASISIDPRSYDAEWVPYSFTANWSTPGLYCHYVIDEIASYRDINDNPIVLGVDPNGVPGYEIAIPITTGDVRDAPVQFQQEMWISGYHFALRYAPSNAHKMTWRYRASGWPSWTITIRTTQRFLRTGSRNQDRAPKRYVLEVRTRPPFDAGGRVLLRVGSPPTPAN